MVPGDMQEYLAIARRQLEVLENPTTDIDSLHLDDRDFLCRNHLALVHQPADYTQTRFTACGEYPSGERKEAYLEVTREMAEDAFHAENTIQGLRPGCYRLLAAVRAAEAEHSGVSLFCKTDNVLQGLHRIEIPAQGRTGGNIWFTACVHHENRSRDKTVSNPGNDLNRLLVNNSRGYGWNRVVIDDIRVGADGNLTYGVSTRPTSLAPPLWAATGFPPATSL